MHLHAPPAGANNCRFSQIGRTRYLNNTVCARSDPHSNARALRVYDGGHVVNFQRQRRVKVFTFGQGRRGGGEEKGLTFAYVFLRGLYGAETAGGEFAAAAAAACPKDEIFSSPVTLNFLSRTLGRASEGEEMPAAPIYIIAYVSVVFRTPRFAGSPGRRPERSQER